MSAQMSIFDILYPDRIDPIAEVAKMATPMWTRSRDSIIKCHDKLDLKHFAAAVRHEYCPYGCAGHYGGEHTPNTMIGYDMRTPDISVEYYDEHGDRQRIIISWEDFAREIRHMIETGNYRKETKA